jgi:hypothetical protein
MIEKHWLSILTNGALLAFGIYWAYMSLKMTFAPHHVGTLVADPSDGCSCKEKQFGQTSVMVQVKLRDGRLIEAKTSPCLFCLENVREGDTVGITRFGRHWIVQRSPGWVKWKS